MKKVTVFLYFLAICSILIASTRDDEAIEIGFKYDMSTKDLFLNSKKKKDGILKEEEALIYSSSDTDKIILDNKGKNSNGNIELLKLRDPKENEIKIYQEKK